MRFLYDCKILVICSLARSHVVFILETVVLAF